ncbi:Outer membrane protein beta-barrel domain-containing protein [Fibrobacter sp. UWT3]|uniref:outer membrane beta-barrel protein n=1 Tax=Fibrobacter sp. UWT3 TaxID=1896225 RepID=UPI000BC502D0|nr:outer membrane beta-barrel protein [Fibrobacter sp. UWT3]MBR2308279.1 outer membrane beta-barrel protein [Fibrobacter sp.]SOE75392.1 Outer membrane protein beta-barrel domain-containing protein [Fibrobacter sp. UWT3]
MNFFKSILAFAAFSATVALAQGEYPAETDSAWIASQNGGSTELNDGSEEPNPECIGDGCGEQAAPEPEKAADATRKSWEKEDAKGPADEDECTPADSLLPECQEDNVATYDDDADDDTYDRYINDNSDISRASREGFSSGFSLGFRVAGGLNKIFLGDEIDDWGIGYEANGGIITLTKLGNSGLYASAELSVGYYRYRYEAKLDEEDYNEQDEATLNVVLFEVPVVLKYAIGGGNLTLGLGVDIGLKLTGSSKFKQTIETSTLTETDESDDDLIPSAGVEVGGIFEIGYTINRNFSVDLRFNQRVLNLLNQDVVAVTSMTGMKLLASHATLGFSLYL